MTNDILIESSTFFPSVLLTRDLNDKCGFWNFGVVTSVVKHFLGTVLRRESGIFGT